MILNDLKYLFKLSRPRFWLYLAGPALVGMVYGSPALSTLLTVQNLLILLYFLIPANVMLYGVNDYFDRRIDRKNPKKDDKEAGYDSRMLTDTAILASTVSGLGLFVLAPETFIWSAVFLLLSIEYSAPPLRFKTKPFLDSLSNGLYALPFIIVFTSVSGNFPPVPVVAGAWLWTMAMHTFSAIPDIEPDRSAGVQTTATFLGEKKTFVYCIGTWLASATSMGFFHPLLGVLFLIYPVVCAGIFISGTNVKDAYWWYPYLNGFTGMLITLYGLRVLFHA